MQAADSKLVVSKFGVYLYDNIVLFAPEAEDFSKITYDDISAFVDQGGNLLLAASENVGESMRNFAENCGVEFDPKGSVVLDHFSFSEAHDISLQHTAVLTDKVAKSEAILGHYLKLPVSKARVLYRGIGHAVDESNVLAVKTLVGNPSSYSANPSQSVGDYPENAGADTLLVTALQARNNARVLVSGSLDLFSNAFFGAGLGNEAYCADVAAWTFGDRGVLRFKDIKHSQADGTPPDVILHEKERPDIPVSMFPDPELTRNSLIYRIKDDITYSMVVEEWKQGTWHPFQANDMQLEFVMLDAHVVKTMTADAAGKFSVTFKAPDNYGIFKFRVLYRRSGYSVLHTEETISLRPYKHNEYDRFLLTAYPYYASAFSALAAFSVFSIFFMFSTNNQETDKKAE
jgi:oligosaccharyltransferase complex subunit beta